MNHSIDQLRYLAETMPDVSERKSWVQNEGYAAWVAANRRGTMEMATGTGKTRIGVRAAVETLKANPDALVYIVVPTETLRDVDWPNEFKEAGYEGWDQKCTIVCWVALEKQRPERDVDLVVLDEVHHFTPLSSAFFGRDEYKVFSILGLTATLPGDYYDSDKDKLNLINWYCPSVFKVTMEEAIALKIISDFEMYVLKFDLDDSDPYVDGGTKKKPFKTTERKRYDYLTKQLQRATYMKNEAMKFVWIQKRTQFLMNLRSKTILAKDVLAQVMTKQERTLIFCGSIEKSVELCGEQVYNSSTSDEYLELFRMEKIWYLGVVQALNEGKNLPNMDQILIVQLNSKELNLIQRIGRTVRWREGHIAKVIVLVAKNTADEKWYKTATENFDKSRIKEFYVKPESQRAA